MKIVIDNTAFTIQKIGGISVVWYEIIQRLLKDKKDKKVDLCFVECPDAIQNYYRKLLDLNNCIIYPISEFFFKLLRYVNPKLGIKEKYIFHSTYYRISRDIKAVNFTTVHDFIYERSGIKSLGAKLHIWQQRQAVEKADAVICISENTKKDLFYYYKNVDPSKVFVVYNGVSEEYKVLDCKNYDLPFPKESYCIYVGARQSYKNFVLSAKSAAAFGLKLVIIGSQLTIEETKLLNDIIGEGEYICYSKVSNERLNELYNAAFALLYLSTYEGFGIPCLEAQKAGCPVVACNISSIPEVCCDANLLIEEQTVDAVCEKLGRLAQPVFRDEIIKKGIAFSETFSWDRSYSDLMKIYKTVYDHK